ncbi:MAG: acyltransferase [Actinomycetota bacterium]|nr:acyltransferase [Actinomycetota bacterium]
MSDAVVAPPAATLRPHYPSLEGLRTIGVMALFFQHTGYTTGLQARAGFGWMGHLELGPTMFFVLSSFLLYQPFVSANLLDRTPQRWGRFVRTRLLRVVPAYWITLALLMLFFRADPNDPLSGGLKVDGWRDGLAIFGFAQTYNPDWFFHGITSAYTLNVEFVFYLLLPLYAYAVARFTSGRALGEKVKLEFYALGAVVVGSAVWRLAIELLFEDERRQCVAQAVTGDAHLACAAVQWFPGYADYFALGMGVAVIASWRLARAGEPGWLRRIGALGSWWWAAALGLFVIYSGVLGTKGLAYVSPMKAEARHFMNAAIVVCLLLPGVFGAQGRGGVRWFLQWKPIAYVGLVSYGVYLWHQGWTDNAMEYTDSRPLHANFLLITGIAVALSVVCAVASWYALEKPINRRRDIPLKHWFRPVPKK